MYGIVDLPAYLTGAVLITVLPGPNSVQVATLAARRGALAGYTTVAGVLTGDTILIALAASGLATALQHAGGVYPLVTGAGAGYLAYSGLCMLRDALRHLHPPTPTAPAGNGQNSHAEPAHLTTTDPMPGLARVYCQALRTSLTNIKMAAFFLSYLTPFVDATYPHPAASYTLLATLIQLLNGTYLTVLTLAGTRIAAALRHRRHLTTAALATAGTIFIAYAAHLAPPLW